MIIHFDADLQPQHVVTYAAQAYVDWLLAQPDAAFVHLAEAWPIEEIALERDAATGGVLAFHAPPGGIRRAVALLSNGEDSGPPGRVPRDLEAERAALSARADAVFGRQAQLRYPLASVHGAKLTAARETPDVLSAEAEQRGMSVDELAAAIQDQAARQAREIMALDADRLALKREIAAAADIEALDALAARIGG